MGRDSKILTKEEKEKIEKIAEWLLEPIGGKVKISDNYSTINCSMSSDSYHYTKWNEYWYQIKIETNKGPHEYGEVFDGIDISDYLAQAAWGIAYTIWGKFDHNIYSPLAEKLWPAVNGNVPDYEIYGRQKVVGTNY